MKTVIVTGASGQLGKAICKDLIKNDNFVIGVDKQKNSELDKLKNFIFKKVDITSQDNVRKFFFKN